MPNNSLQKAPLMLLLLFAVISTYAQNLKLIKLPAPISGVNEEFSGMCTWKNRVYLEPQYGDFKETKLDGKFNLYSLNADSIGRVIDRKDTALTKYRATPVINLDKLPDSVKKYYEGFEAISIVNNTVFMSIETTDTYAYCFILKGTLDSKNNVIRIDPKHFATLKRYPYISNAGFESVTWLPTEKKLIAYYEFNGMKDGGMGYLIDTSLKHAPQEIKAPFLYFRITDIAATQTGQIYGINYFWNGDYDHYLNNDFITKPEAQIKATIPSLRDSLNSSPDYLKRKTFARIVELTDYKTGQWQQVATFEGYKDNWEGITLFRKGALIVTDANRSNKQLCLLGYVEF
jgi:hypothetical protein